MSEAQNMSEAIAILTTWVDDETGDEDFTAKLVQSVVDERGVAAVEDLLGGLISVAGLLLLRLAKATGQRDLEILQDIARRYGAA